MFEVTVLPPSRIIPPLPEETPRAPEEYDRGEFTVTAL
jgi:hypothetical protein